ncbi:MAG: sigma-70 family RNA polymerase sigma factor [Deltaproteobacteria bacterium]|nr:sigma-70 family RNA polymerase sigma factor [Deltaproteobacteria bacterium]
MADLPDTPDLGALVGADPAALAQLWDQVYPTLRALARRRMAREAPGHTLSATALVHEAYAELAGQQGVFQNRAHFMALAAMAMRRVLWHHAEARRAQKRGGDLGRITFADELFGQEVEPERLLALEQTLQTLEAMDARQAQVVVMRVYGGMAHEEIAEVLGVSVPTVGRDWRVARAWLAKNMAG